MAHYPAHQQPGASVPGHAAPSGGAPAQRQFQAPSASPRPTATPSRTPSRFGRLGAVFRYKYYSRDELEDASRRQGSRADGLDPALEKKRRKNYVAWMNDLTKELRLPHLVLSTAIIYMHRYFALKSMLRTDIWLMGMAALFTASKSENHPLQLDFFIAAVLRVRRNGEPVVNSFKPPRAKLLAKIRADPARQRQLRDWVLTAERALLYTLGFKFMVVHPHSTVLGMATKYKLDDFAITTPGRVAADMANYISVTTLSLQYKPETLGIACLEFALRELAKKSPPMVKRVPLLQTGQTWWQEAGATPAEVDDIHSEIMEVFTITDASAAPAPLPSRPPGATSPRALSHVASSTALPARSPAPHLPAVKEERGGSSRGGGSDDVSAAPACPAAGSPDDGSDASAMTGTASAQHRGDTDMVTSAAPPPAVSLAGCKRPSPAFEDFKEPPAKRSALSCTPAADAQPCTHTKVVAESGVESSDASYAATPSAPPTASPAVLPAETVAGQATCLEAVSLATAGLAAPLPPADCKDMPAEPGAGRPSPLNAENAVALGEG